MRVPFEILKSEFERVLLILGFTASKASFCACTFAENSRDGVYTHGLNRFSAFVEYIRLGLVNPAAEPTPVGAFGALEQWDGNLGPGILNASFCMGRAINLAQVNGISCVALRNTSHWMCAGTYGWQAAEAGLIGICFTNTKPNMPPWGGIEPRLGNNPLVIAVPRKGGHVVLDMALSQYSVGKLNSYQNNNEALPLPGGYDNEGNLSTDAAAILQSGRLLPVGFWKGSGLAIVLDLLATVLAQGKSTARISEHKYEGSCSQVFICIKSAADDYTAHLIEEIISYTKTSKTEKEVDMIAYPGEHTLRTREKSLREGVLVDESIWNKVQAM